MEFLGKSTLSSRRRLGAAGPSLCHHERPSQGQSHQGEKESREMEIDQEPMISFELLDPAIPGYSVSLYLSVCASINSLIGLSHFEIGFLLL